MRACLRKLGDKKPFEFISEKWEQQLGQRCLSCKEKINREDCISLCKCYIFCHEQCFLKEFSPYIFDNLQVKCARCCEEVVFEFSYISKWQCNTKPMSLIPIIILFVLTFTFLGLLVSGVISSVVTDSAGYSIFSIALFFLITSAILNARKHYIDLAKLRVKNTNLLGVQYTATELKHRDYENDLKKMGAQSHNNVQYDI